MKTKSSRLMLTVSAVVLFWSLLIPVQAADEAQERAELAKALAGSKVTLHQGLQTSASKGKPISAKFEVEDGKLQLSIYTVKGDGFSDVGISRIVAWRAPCQEIIGALGTPNEVLGVNVNDYGYMIAHVAPAIKVSNERLSKPNIGLQEAIVDVVWSLQFSVEVVRVPKFVAMCLAPCHVICAPQAQRVKS